MREMYSVLPFKADGNGNAVSENKEIEAWLRLITSDLIDNYKGVPMPEFGDRTFYQYAGDEFDFHCKHRLLFHWGFNSEPWSDALEERLSKCPWYPDGQKKDAFRKALTLEQARRNRAANEAAERLFGFASEGKEAAWANGILAIVYDVHLLGDWNPEDNSDFDGVTEPSAIAADIMNALRRIDSRTSGRLEKELKKLVRKEKDRNRLSVLIVGLLQERLPAFILSSNYGALELRFKKSGFVLK